MSGVSGGAIRCHYEVLQVDRDVSDTDLRKAYRKLALKYHPDKNPDNVEECTKLFNSLQQAYEVLSDPQERAWYDKHREEILHGAGSDFKDDSLNIMPFFSTSCFSGFGDDSRGFYKVYGAVFCRIADEEEEYVDEGSERLPSFGLSTTPYEEVHTFYAYWQSFSTVRSFVWEDVHDLRQAPNRKVQRLMERENKKERLAAKKKRNEAVKQLVAFVRKRDKRVQKYRESLEEKERERKKRAEEKQARDKQRRLREREEARERYQAQKWEESLEQDLLSVEARLDVEYGCDGEEERDGGCDEGGLFCPACNKLFKSDKTFANHEKSRRHRDNVVLLKQLLEEEERELRGTSQQTTTTDGQQMTTDKQTTTTDERQTTTTDEQQTTTTTDVQQATSINDTQETMTSSMGAEQDRLSDEGEEVGEAKAGVGVKRKEGEEDEGKAGEVKRKEGEEEEGKAGEVKRKEGEEEEGKAGEVKRKEEEEDEGKAGKVKRKVEVEDEGEVVIGVCERLESQQLSDSDTDLANAASLRFLGQDSVKKARDNLPTADHATPTLVAGGRGRPDGSDDDEWFSSKSKRKTKRKGKAKETATSTNSQTGPDLFKCGVCSVSFNSRNKLFGHIETTGHTVPLPPSSSQSQHKEKRKTKANKK